MLDTFPSDVTDIDVPGVAGLLCILHFAALLGWDSREISHTLSCTGYFLSSVYHWLKFSPVFGETSLRRDLNSCPWLVAVSCHIRWQAGELLFTRPVAAILGQACIVEPYTLPRPAEGRMNLSHHTATEKHNCQGPLLEWHRNF